MSGTRSEAIVELQDFDQKWDYNHPDSTEMVFRALLPAARAKGDTSYSAQLLTQLARTEALQKKFADAHRTLDAAEGLIAGGKGMDVARIRYLLELGRVLNTSKDPGRGKEQFLAAWDSANAAGAEFHAVDAAHMLGIVSPPAEALEWNRKAIAAAERAESERAQQWLGSLYNNVGWTLHDMGDYPAALEMFVKGLAFREAHHQAPETRIAKWTVARCQRSLGRIDEALAGQHALEAEFKAIGEEDGFVYEELGELLTLKGDPAAAREYFGRAYDLLSKDPWLPGDAPDRIARLKALGGR